ncbi:MAG TPA: hypothetical protein VJ508_06725, partial [Saprospiraceae bacterium]|nr:hypothetical protein [Saprospiraceae bacterium]
NNGLIASGINPDSKLVEVMELHHHPFFLGTQYHPELKSTVEKPHPLFVAFIKACLEHKTKEQSSGTTTKSSMPVEVSNRN